MTDGSGADGARPGPDGRELPLTDAAILAAALGVALRSAGLPAGPDRCERLARAVTVMGAATIAELHACALATMVSDPSQVETFERVFAEMFAAAAPGRPAVTAPQSQPGMTMEPADPGAQPPAPPAVGSGELPPVLREVSASASGSSSPDSAEEDAPEVPAIRRVASATERLQARDFGQLTPDELSRLAVLMRELTIAVPPRRTRRYRPRKEGARLDMRRTMRLATRTAGEPVRIARRAVRVRPRRLIVLCDISGSMEPYAKALLQLMYVASRGSAGLPAESSRPRTEVFTFATRLTRLTPFLSAATPETMLARAGEAAPDWAGGTRIGAALREFNDRYGVRGMARGAVVLIISDGWETGDPAVLGEQMARLHRVAYRIVWANPRTQSSRYRPEVGGMAAAWPYCDAVVSAHNFEALDDLIAALRAPAVRRPPAVPAAGASPEAGSDLPAPGTPPVPARPMSLPITGALSRHWLGGS
jgi:hypothetical protein